MVTWFEGGRWRWRRRGQCMVLRLQGGLRVLPPQWAWRGLTSPCAPQVSAKEVCMRPRKEEEEEAAGMPHQPSA